MSLANKISILRILLAPCIVAALLYYSPSRDSLRYLALGLFVVGILSDALDGFVARSKREQSQLGTLLDPIADKCLILSTLISCSVIHGLPNWMRIPAWFNLIVISRDVILIAGTFVIFFSQGRWAVRPSRLGKWAIASQMLVVPTVLLQLPMKWPLLALASTLTILSGVEYLRRGIRLLS